MKVRYKKTGEEASSSGFNIHAINEVLTGEDSAYIHELDVWLTKTTPPGWKDMREAFRDHDLITDNYNRYFFEPWTEEDRERGFTLY